MKYNPSFLLRFARESRKKSRKSARKSLALHQIPTHLHKSAHFSLCAGGDVRGLVVLAEAGERISLGPARGEKIYNTVTFH